MTRTQPMHLSFSSLNQSCQCRRGWFSQKILGRKLPPGDSAQFGLSFESALSAELRASEFPAQHRQQREEPKSVPEIAQPTGAQIVELTAAVDRAEERLQEEIRRGIAVYRATEGTLTPMGANVAYSGSETAVSVSTLTSQKEVWLEPGQWEILADYYGVRSSIHLPFLGYIDFLEQTGPMGMSKRIVDLKTSSRKGWQLSWGLQTTLYALYERAQTCEAHLVVRPTVKLDENGEPVQSKRPAQFRCFVYRFMPSAATFAWAMQWVGTWAEVIRKDSEADCIESLPATPSWSCPFCPENGICEPYLLSKLTALGDFQGGDE